jgi:hypothetical protein
MLPSALELANLKETDALFRSLTSEIWRPTLEPGSDQPTLRERRAVELYVWRHYSVPWYDNQIRSGGWKGCLQTAWTGPNLYGLA